jgi:antitoxin ParD1/3/4
MRMRRPREQPMRTTTMNISLPETLKEYVKERVAEEPYSNPSDYIGMLIREDQKRHAEQKLEQLLLEGLRSGEATSVTPGDFEAIRGEVRAHVAKRQQHRKA